jgi:hypothetical protein
VAENMATTTLFPGVYTQINDASISVANLPGAWGFTVGLAAKGIDNEPYNCYGVSDLINEFGEGNWEKYGQAWYVAEQYLQVQGGFYYMRILPPKAKYSVLKLLLDINDNHVIMPDVISSHGTLADVEDWANDPDLAGKLNAVVFFPVGRGKYGNDYKMKITESTYLTDIIEEEVDDGFGNITTIKKFNHRVFNIDIYETRDGEDYIILSRPVSFERDFTDLSGDSLFIEDVLASTDILRCMVHPELDRYLGTETSVVDGETVLSEAPALFDWSLPFGGLKVPFLAGDDGWNSPNPKITDIDVKSELIKAFTGTNVNPRSGDLNYRVTDKDCIFFSVVFDAGYPLEVKNAILTLCESRGNNTMGFLDCLDNKTFREIGGTLGSRKDPSGIGMFNSYLVALFDPFSLIFDPFTGRDFWVTPVYHAARCFAKTERDYAVWWPFAGPNRGVCPGIKKLRYMLVGKSKEQFKLNQINPIINLENKGTTLGYVIMGNWTSQRRASSLQDVHVVLTLQHITRELEFNLIFFIYELNDMYTWELMRSVVNGILGDIKARRGLEKYNTKVTASDEDRKQRRCRVDVLLTVTGAIEAILVSLNVE